MLRNYLLTAFRNLRKNKVFSLINILGLALGMACSLLIMLWVIDEKKVDAFHPDADRRFMVYQRQYYDGKVVGGYYTPGNLGAELKRVMPQVAYAANHSLGDVLTFQVGEKIINETGGYAGEDFFQIFGFPLLQGKPATALNTPVCMAISRNMAEQFFGSASAAIGKTIRCENKKDFTVNAVFENPGPYSSLQFDYLINWTYYQDENSWSKNWENNGPNTCIKLKPGANSEVVRVKLKKFLDGYNKGQSKSFYVELDLQPFNETYLNANIANGKINGGRVEYVRLFSLVALFILLIACINFMNLTTARSAKRALEIGIRKVVGAQKSNLQRQFLGEAILFAVLSGLLALIMVILVLPFFNGLTQKQIALPFNSPIFWLLFFGLTLITGLVSGSYPALVLSSFNPIRVLKGSIKFSSASLLFRKGLVVFQFALSVMLIIGTIIVSQQVHMIQTRQLGYDRGNLIFVQREGEIREKSKLFKDEALRLPGVSQVTMASEAPTDIGSTTGGVDWPGKDPQVTPQFTQAAVGYDFVKTMGATMAEGRDFSTDFATDSAAYVLNETAAKKMGLKHPVGETITFWGKKGTIIGVIKDFHFNSLHMAIMPIIFRLEEQPWIYWLLIKTKPGQNRQAIAGLSKLWKEINPKFPFTYRFADEEYNKLYVSEQVIGSLSNYFAFLAIFISCLGLLGLAMFTAEQRMKEMGIRKVLGASGRSLFTLLSKEFLYPVSVSLLIAIPLAWLAMHKWLQNYEYRVAITWWVFALAGLVATLVALFTISFQALKAVRANPARTLKSE